jgi:four helix bundle protein
MAMAPHDLIERTRRFALLALRFIRCLPDTPEAREAGGQLRRSANGLRSNYRASQKGRSRAEFTAKLGTASEEADECVDWLEYLRDARIAHSPGLLQEADELAKIMAAAVKTARVNNAQLKRQPDG